MRDFLATHFTLYYYFLVHMRFPSNALYTWAVLGVTLTYLIVFVSGVPKVLSISSYT